MHLFYDLFPVILFFFAFKYYGIYVATAVGIVATAIQVLSTRLIKRKWDSVQVITFTVFVLFGGMTLYFHNPIFVKWKPTVVFWIFGLVILFTHYFTHKPLIQRLMERSLQEKGAVIKQDVWKKLNLMWTCFFLFLGGINLYVAYFYSNEAWVNFKLYGITSCLLIFSLLQAVYLMRHMSEVKSQ